MLKSNSQAIEKRAVFGQPGVIKYPHNLQRVANNLRAGRCRNQAQRKKI
jgi:hypothetical protein